MRREPTIKHQETFDHVLSLCPRSMTKGNFINAGELQSLGLNLLQAAQLETGIVNSYQTVHDIFIHEPISTSSVNASPVKRLMFTLLVNALEQLSFKTGDALARSCLLIVELAKKRVLNAHLVLSNPQAMQKEQQKTLLPETHGLHYFYVTLSNPTASSAESPNVSRWFNEKQDTALWLLNTTQFPSDYQYLDPWAESACLWEDFKPSDERFTPGIQKHQQYVFNSLAQVGDGMKWVLEQFICCLDDYETQIKSLPERPIASDLLKKISRIFQQYQIVQNDNALKPLYDDVKMLCSFEQCRNAIINNIHKLRKTFQTQLTLLAKEQLFRQAAGMGNLAELKRLHQEGGFSMDARDDQRFHRTALHWAVANGKKDCVDWLLKLGADPFVIDKTDNTPYELVKQHHPEWIPELTARFEKQFRQAAKDGALTTLKQLYYGCDMSIDAQDTKRFHRTALHWAVANGKKDCVDWLLEQGADPFVTDKTGDTPYDLVERHHPEWIPELTAQFVPGRGC